MQIKSILLATILPLSLTLVACNGADKVSEDVSARQDIMKNWKDAMGTMGGMAKNPETFDLAKFQEAANFLAEDAKNPWSHFNNKEDTGNSLDAVWNDTEGFKAQADKFQAATQELKSVAQSATSLEEIMPAFKPVSESCKSCHKGYKVPDK